MCLPLYEPRVDAGINQAKVERAEAGVSTFADASLDSEKLFLRSTCTCIAE